MRPKSRSTGGPWVHWGCYKKTLESQSLWEREKWVERSCSSWMLVGTRTATRPMPQWFFGILKAHWFTPRQGYSGNLKGPTHWMIEWCYTWLGSRVTSRAHGASQVLMLHCSTKNSTKTAMAAIWIQGAGEVELVSGRVLASTQILQHFLCRDLLEMPATWA